MNVLAPAKAASQARHWSDRRRHQRNATRTLEDIASAFPGPKLDNVARHLQDRRMQTPPYFIEPIHQTSAGGGVIDNPLARQILPYYLYRHLPSSPGSSEYALPPVKGKHTVPPIADDDDIPHFSENGDGVRYCHVKSWQDANRQWREYQ